MMLTERQRTILNAVTERYIGTGTPVSSKELVGAAGLQVSSSTVRNEFALLEEKGYLTHPHTSAGRVPTDQGYREFVDFLMSGAATRPGQRLGRRVGALGEVHPEDLTGEIETALRQATDAMSRATNLLALVLAPRMSGARLRHVELLMLHPAQLMYVFIVSTGAVMKGLIDWPSAVDSGLVEWARTYLNETFEGQTLTSRLIKRTLEDPGLSPREARFLQALAPAFQRLVDEQSEDELYVGGASRLLVEPRLQDVSSLRDLLALLEERFLLLQVLRGALGSGTVVVRIGSEHEATHASAVLRGSRQLRAAAAPAGYGQPRRAHAHGLRARHSHGQGDGSAAFRARR